MQVASIQKLRVAWQNLPRRVQIALFAIAIATIFMFVFVLRATTSNEWVPVTEEGMSVQELGKAQQVLEDAGYKIHQNETSTAIEVPKADMQKAAATLMENGMAAKGNKTTCAQMFGEKGSMSFSDTSKTTSVKLETCQEGQTANDIEMIQGVNSANVDVMLPEKSLFSDEEQPAKAAVTIDTGGEKLSAKTVKGIQETVASRFEGLRTDAVSVMDESGQTISKTADDEESTNQAKKLEIESKYNALVESKLTKQFEKIVGAGNVAVMSNAELDLDAITRQVEQNTTPEGGQPIVELEDYEKELLKGANSVGTEGVPGTGSNLNGVDPEDRRIATSEPTGTASGSGDYAKDRSKASYAVDKVREHILVAPGSVIRNRGAVIVDESVDEAAANSVSNAMQALMGGNTQDSFSFSRAPLASAKPTSDESAAADKARSVLAGYVKWLLLGLGLIGLAFTIRRGLTQRTAELLSPPDDMLYLDPGDFTPIPIAELEAALASGEPEPEEASRRELQQKVKNIAESKPQDVANEIRRWMMQDEDTKSSSRNNNRRAAS